MGSQSVTQAIVVEQEALNQNHGALVLALFNPDGTPFVPLVETPEDQVLDGGGP
jgi:uncharacterized membrane protein